MKQHNYFVYITTNASKSTLYVGVTSNLQLRLRQHFENRGQQDAFTGRYYCYLLVYFERHQFVEHAIAREKEIKKWRREKKVKLIESINLQWNFLNEEVDFSPDSSRDSK